MGTIEVILLKEVLGLGSRGAVKTVKRGYAQNYLIPNGFAAIATPQKIAELSKHAKAVERKKQRSHDRGKAALKKISGKTFSLSARASETGTLYAGVGPKEIAKLLYDTGYAIPLEAIGVAEPIKTVGSHRVTATAAGADPVTFTVHIQGDK